MLFKALSTNASRDSKFNVVTINLANAKYWKGQREDAGNY